MPRPRPGGVMDADKLHAPVLAGLNLPWARLIHEGEKYVSPPHATLGHLLPCLDFFFLHSGRMLVTHSDSEGRERIMFYFGSGMLFNEASAAANLDAPDSPFICQEECVYYRFPHSMLHDPAFVSENPDLVINLMTGLGIKLLIHHTSLGNYAGIPALARVSRFFISLVKKHGSLSFDPDMSQEAMATLLGMNRATLVRSLHELRKNGAIKRCAKHALEIGDLDVLQGFAKN